MQPLKLLSLALLLLACVGWPSRADALGKEYAHFWRLEIATMQHENPRYVMDARIKPDDPISKGVDCSRFCYLTARGMPVRRTTAQRMARGESGWDGVDVPSMAASKELDLGFYTFKATRPNGHVVIRWKNGIIHASGGRGHIVTDPLKGWVLKTSRVRHLTIGD